MKCTETALPGVLLIEPTVFGDERGYFLESWNADAYAQAGIRCPFVQDNESKSRRGVIRGLHWQAAPYTQAKLVRAVLGRVLDVVVDIRRGSPTYGRHFSIELSGEDKRQLFIPKGLAHGFAVLSDEAVFAYKCDAPYHPAAERGVMYDDPSLGIDWRIPENERILSPKDRRHPLWAAIAPWEDVP